MFLCILRALTRTQNTQKHVQKGELRLRRNMYEAIASTRTQNTQKHVRGYCLYGLSSPEIPVQIS